jgi:hypothetical protein
MRCDQAVQLVAAFRGSTSVTSLLNFFPTKRAMCTFQEQQCRLPLRQPLQFAVNKFESPASNANNTLLGAQQHAATGRRPRQQLANKVLKVRLLDYMVALIENQQELATVWPVTSVKFHELCKFSHIIIQRRPDHDWVRQRVETSFDLLLATFG